MEKEKILKNKSRSSISCKDTSISTIDHRKKNLKKEQRLVIWVMMSAALMMTRKLMMGMLITVIKYRFPGGN